MSHMHVHTSTDLVPTPEGEAPFALSPEQLAQGHALVHLTHKATADATQRALEEACAAADSKGTGGGPVGGLDASLVEAVAAAAPKPGAQATPEERVAADLAGGQALMFMPEAARQRLDARIVAMVRDATGDCDDTAQVRRGAPFSWQRLPPTAPGPSPGHSWLRESFHSSEYSPLRLLSF